ncbi:C40 family peptidase [Nitrobacter sp.]|uniref:C40 family peptidase n=1 Tax=unclassified Nitrobacter TaxID=2620411 RepID=UPI00321FF3FB
MDDPRLTPARPEVAARHLEGRIDAARFTDGEEYEVVESAAPLQREPAPDAMLQTQALRGERVTIYDHSAEGWAWGQLNGDGYVGWLPDRALARPGAARTHKVVTLRTFAFPGPSIKLPPVATFSLGARLAVQRHDGCFAVTDDRLYIPANHLAPLDHAAADFVTVAEMFVGTPYLWGGKTSLGIDCSGLVQVALNASGIACPRDSDMQEAAMGRALSPQEAQQPRRGDLMFWKGHVAVVRDEATLLHANAHHMATAIEGIHDAVARIESAGSAVTCVKRLD